MNLVRQDRLQALLFTFKHPGRTGEHGCLDTTDLGHRPFTGEIAFQNSQVPFGIERIAQGSDHLLIRWRLRRNISQNLSQGFALHGAAITVQQATIEQQLHHLRNAAGVVKINGDEAAAWFEVADHRHPLPNRFEIVDGERYACGSRNRQQVQHRIGGATHGHDHADGVFKGFARQQIQRSDVGGNGLHQHLS